MSCQRCGNAIGTDECWARVHRRGAPLEPVGFFDLCEECHESLLAWVGVRPDTPDLWHTPEPQEPVRPFSCGDERLEYT